MEVLAERRKKFGDSHKDTVDSYNTLTLFYQDQGYYEQGAKIARRTLKTLQKKREADDISVLQVKARLGYLLHYLGDDSKAEALIRDAYDGYVKRLGSRDPLTLKTSWNLAMTMHSQARFEESMKISMETWRAQEKVIGEKHPETIKSQLLVATNFQAQSDFKPALEYMREIHTMATSLLGSHHRYSLVATLSLASCIIASTHGKEAPQAYEEAEELYRVVLAGARQQLRNDHPDTLVAKTGIATALRLRGSFEEAETLQREALDKLKSELGKEHPWFLNGQENLARILCEQKASKSREKEGMKLAQVVLKKREKRLGWNHADTKRIAELVIQLLPSGQKREKLEEKVIQQSSVTFRPLEK
jgi:tetratricopeptide (TPR) repeat protein